MEPKNIGLGRDRSAPAGRACFLFIAVGLLWLVGDLFGLLGGLGEYTFVLIAIATLVASQVGLKRYRPRVCWPWRALALSIVLFLVGGAVRQAVGSYGDLTASRSSSQGIPGREE